MKARLVGASEARAPTLTFLDAHCECTSGWLEPLMAQLAADRTAVPCPVIDSIDASSFHFAPGAVGRSVGVFGWDFNFGWWVRGIIQKEIITKFTKSMVSFFSSKTYF